ncbi:hypothetical protein TCAL_16096, partial [Tigriopus californicus]
MPSFFLVRIINFFSPKDQLSPLKLFHRLRNIVSCGDLAFHVYKELLPMVMVEKGLDFTNGVPVPRHESSAGKTHGYDVPGDIGQIQIDAILL